jgi:hypothetical protein
VHPEASWASPRGALSGLFRGRRGLSGLGTAAAIRNDEDEDKDETMGARPRRAARAEDRSMSDYAQSTSGRLLTLAVGLALLGGGAAVLLGGSMAPVLLGGGLLGGICCAILAVGLGIERFPFQTALSLISLPWILFLYVIAQSLIAHARSNGGYLLLVLAAAAFARAAFVGVKLAAPRQAEAHAH